MMKATTFSMMLLLGRFTTNGFVLSGSRVRKQPKLNAIDFEEKLQSEQDQRKPFMDQNDFELEIGRALDTLRSDYPNMLTESPGT